MKKSIILIISLFSLNFLVFFQNSYSYDLVKIDQYPNSKIIKVGTGSIHGIYFPTGASICRLVNNATKVPTKSTYRCEAEPSSGSFMNLNNLVEGKINFGMVQSEIQYRAYHKMLSNKDSKQDYTSLRAVFSLQTEAYTMLVRKDSDIKSFSNIKGKKINIGPADSTIRSTMTELIKVHKWNIKRDFSKVLEIGVNEQTEALCAGKVDAILFVVGHPNNAVKEANNQCGARIIPIDSPYTDSLVKSKLFMNNTIIPGGMYLGNERDIKTLGVKATLMTTSTTKDEVVHLVVKSVMENFDSFKSMNPALSHLTKESMVSQGNIASFHKAALEYYKKEGLISHNIK